MPSTPNPLNGPLGPVWTAVLQNMQSQKQKAADLAGAKQQGNIYDQWMNVVEVAGSNLNQVVVIGAAWKVGGVQVSTGFANGTPGRAKQTDLATGTIDLTAGSSTATLHAPSGQVFTSGMQIGADDSNLADAVAPGTTIGTITGSTTTGGITTSTITLIEPPNWPAPPYKSFVFVGGTGLYCASCNWTVL